MLLFASVLVFGLWGLVLGVLWAASFPRLPSAGPETTELGPEPPAISNLLVHRFRVTHAAMPATLLDLAARRLLEIQMLGRDNYVIRVRKDGDTNGLLPYERQLYDWVRSQATGGSAPLEALSVGNPGQAQSFWNRFERSVVSDARKRGLVRNRWAKSDWVVLGTILAVAFGLLALSFGAAGVGDSGEDPMDVGDWLIAAAFGWGGVLAVITRFQDLRDTKQGQEVAGRWLGVRNAFRKSTAFGDAPPSHVTIWERNMSHAVAMGLAHEAVRQLPFEEEDPETAWTRQTGVWREIDISYPARFGWGERPLWVLWGGIWRVTVWGGLAFIVVPTVSRLLFDVIHEFRTSNSDQLGEIDPMAINGLIALIVAIIGGWSIFLLVRLTAGLIRLWRALSDLGKPPVVVEGQVVKLHMGRVAVDNGKVEETKGWTPPPGTPALTRGMKVRYARTPYLWHVTKVEILALPEDAEPHQEPARERPGGGFAGAPAFNLGAINAATGLALAPVSIAAGADNDADIMGMTGPFGRAVASETLTDGQVEVLIVKLDPAEMGGITGTLMSMMTSRAQQRWAKFEGAGDGGFWMGEDTLIVDAGSVRYAVRVTGKSDLSERQHLTEEIARVLVEGPAVAAPATAAPPGTELPGGALGAPVIIAAAAAAAMAEARSTASGSPEVNATITRPEEAVSLAEASPDGAAPATTAAESAGWATPGPDSTVDTAASPELEVFASPEPVETASGVLFTPPPVYQTESAGIEPVEAPDFSRVETAGGRVIVPADVGAPPGGFPRPRRRYGPDEDVITESVTPPIPEQEPVAQAPVAPPIASIAAAPVATTPPDGASPAETPNREPARPESSRGFPRPRPRLDDEGDRSSALAPPPSLTGEPIPATIEVQVEPEAPRSPSRNPWKR